ncbi:AAA family ATPase [Sinisalibacter aestuarii]|uniref:Nuclease SbcCD subunit C n=1 Tax=Sinisalibacter aestuarii TaxID=2949426 RepID=A0ABQ5LQV8_9RHOB|nr:SMC family ATPase [Sinisalibacter aestuarii]GKY87394.1 nuclease SbcCD subunit C [Sinisalibacter aestuarii]
MRPVRLSMQAFGPYAGREMVDFREAISTGLFGVYGSTGSGKSTIFSAMSFALFGEPARAEQDAKSLRSDHAAADLPTEVEFVFELGEKTYLVRRRPAQSRPKQRGEGETWDNPEAWIFDATGVPFEELSPENSGKVLAEKKLGEVGRVIGDLLGYGLEQFRQIVLLPQGKFEAFLAANTDSRRAILRDLFDVSLYRELAAHLKAQADAAEKEVRQKRELAVLQIAEEGFESLDALEYGLVEAAGTLAEKENARKAAMAAREAAHEALVEARRIEGLFKACLTARTSYDALDRETPEIDALAAWVREAEKARGAQDLEAIWQNESNKHDGAVAMAKEASETAERASVDHLAAKSELEKAEGKEGEREALQVRLADLERFAGKLESAADLKQAFSEAETAARNASDAVGNAVGALNSLSTTRTRVETDLKSARAADAARRGATEAWRKVQDKLKVAEAAEAAAKAVEEARRMSASKKEVLAGCKAEAEVARSTLNEAEARLARTQALILAEKLETGAPCPVCGSLEHPSPAHGEIEQSGLTEAFRAAERDHEAAEQCVSHAASGLAKVDGILAERIAAAERLEMPDAAVPELLLQVDEAVKALKDLGEEVDITALEAELEKVGIAVESAGSDRDRLQREDASAKAALAEARANHDAAVADITPELRDRNVLNCEINEVRAAGEALRAALQAARDKEKCTREAALSATKDLEAAAGRVKEQAERKTNAEDAFLARLKANGIDRAQYDQLKPEIDRVETDRERVEGHRAKLLEAATRRKDATEAIRGLEKPDLPPLEETLENAKAFLDQAVQAAAAAQVHGEQLAQLKTTIEQTYRQLDELETETGPLRELAQRVDGKNDLKLDLETFAIGAMFDRVLEAANLRLKPMTQGRYRLERALEAGGRGRRGLEIQAFDINTGKARPTSTLSGGETFIAALALALGLADVVESLNGKVRMDTIFIDEGFGSLDTENGAGTLDQVLQVLSNLVRDNRAVGLISHVALVKEAIPNGFYVQHTPAGSHVEQRGAS